MIPPSGSFSVLGKVWETQGSIFKCRLEKSGGEAPEYVEGTVLFLHKVTPQDEAKKCQIESCQCPCHEKKDRGGGDGSEEPFFKTSENLDESGFLSSAGGDVSSEGKYICVDELLAVGDSLCVMSGRGRKSWPVCFTTRTIHSCTHPGPVFRRATRRLH